MKAMLVNNYGEDSVFDYSDVETPTLKPGHLLVRIAASSVNTVDTMIRKMGKELPLSPEAPADTNAVQHRTTRSCRDT